MGKGCRERYLKQIATVITTKRKYPTGYLVVGEYRLSLEIQKDILDILDHSEVTSSHLDFNNYKDEDECLIVMKKAKKQLNEDRHSGKLLILVITNFDRFNEKKMDAVKQLISCQAIGINLLISANIPLVHLVGLTEYMITVDSTAKVLSEFYRYNTQQIIYSLHNESLV
ncbi:hypothetical protein [Bacillus wiedmannii]|uniref:Uncharacterized protein n=1 Tax=Bacillus wiedmannii TaxID=1890302 RepID=A0A2A8BF23_9BACI|nr:hypothetical protein [Bacillus wiedmannii]PEM43913.1 hypothetical protein CN611_29530 [Bacillus wiedmannii]PGA91246.1 hypothetical protein COL92_31175 [Bacillus wiedmannii]